MQLECGVTAIRRRALWLAEKSRREVGSTLAFCIIEIFKYGLRATELHKAFKIGCEAMTTVRWLSRLVSLF